MSLSPAELPALEQLLAYLNVEPDEAAVVSIAATRAPDNQGEWQLAYASLLFGPGEMANAAWLVWRCDAFAATTLDTLTRAGVREPDLAQFTLVGAEWLIARQVLTGSSTTADTAARWLEALLGTGTALTDDTGTTHLVRAQLEPTDALVMGCPHDDTSRLQRLTSAVQRPVLGYRFPCTTPLDAAVPETWLVGSTPVPLPLYQLLGINTAEQIEPSLVVGRAARMAWLAALRMDAHQQLHVSIGFDPERVALGDLEIDLEEYAEDGLAAARRLRLSDLLLPTSTPGETVEVVLPTMGSRISRQVRLYGRDGRLLDTTGRNYFVSRAEVTLTEYQTGATAGFSIGDKNVAATSVTRLAALDTAEREYRRLLDDGLAHRIFDDKAAAMSALQQMLTDARDYLLVLDPYFGHKPDDWDALAKVTVPVKVLAQHERPRRLSPRPAPGPDQSVIQRHSAGLQLRSWDFPGGGTGSAPWHDRVYLWRDGGLTVGTSPSGLGGRLARVDRLSPVEAAAWQTRFHLWWSDPLATTVR